MAAQRPPGRAGGRGGRWSRPPRRRGGKRRPGRDSSSSRRCWRNVGSSLLPRRLRGVSRLPRPTRSRSMVTTNNSSNPTGQWPAAATAISGNNKGATAISSPLGQWQPTAATATNGSSHRCTNNKGATSSKSAMDISNPSSSTLPSRATRAGGVMYALAPRRVPPTPRYLAPSNSPTSISVSANSPTRRGSLPHSSRATRSIVRAALVPNSLDSKAVQI